jgi:arylsulfatase A-like enzyme
MQVGRASAIALLLVAPLSAFAACGRDDGAQVPEKPLNLVMVVLDTLRADHLGLYGYERDTSPHLDALARESVVFERAESAAPWTAPSLISLVTSLYPEVHGVRGWPYPGRMSDDVVTLAEVLKRQGYSTAAFTEGGYAKGDFGLDQGFDTYPRNPGDDASHASNLIYSSRLEGNLARSLSWLRNHQEEPFFLFFQTYEPHIPYRAPGEFIRRYRPFYDERKEHERVRRAVERWNSHRRVDPADSLLVHRHTFHCRLAGLPPLRMRRGFARANLALGLDLARAYQHKPFLKWLRDIYDAEIAYTDEQMSHLWRFLEEEGLLHRTLVLVASDHGEGLGDHGQLGHGKVLFEEILRIALILRVPDGGNEPRRVSQLVRSVDVMPTLLQLMGIPTADIPLQGQSLLPLFVGQSLELHSFSHARLVNVEEDALYSVRSDRWRFVLDRATGTGRLYDLEEDPGETRDVAPSNPDLVASFRGMLDRQDERDQALAIQVGPPAPPVVLDENRRRELRALGYLSDEADD